MQTNLSNKSDLHVAIIMDGNGRWASRRGLPRTAGHRVGASAVRRIVEAAARSGISTLTLFAFSSDNWRRPLQEVTALLSLLRGYLRKETADLVANGIRLSVIGRRDRLPGGLREAIVGAETMSAKGSQLTLRIALDYSARNAITRAGAECLDANITQEVFATRFAQSPKLGPDVDLLIRTGGEKRLSDFLLWECAYAELHFSDVMWPDFTADDLDRALLDFSRRERRFGAAPADAEIALVAAE